jgi:hypothetical protein
MRPFLPPDPHGLGALQRLACKLTCAAAAPMLVTLVLMVVAPVAGFWWALFAIGLALAALGAASLSLLRIKPWRRGILRAYAGCEAVWPGSGSSSVVTIFPLASIAPQGRAR